MIKVALNQSGYATFHIGICVQLISGIAKMLKLSIEFFTVHQI